MDRIWFPVSVVASFVTFTVIARWYVIPYLRNLPRATALIPFLLIHTFRTVGLTFLVSGVTGAPLPFALAAPAAFGDLLATLLAFASILALRLRWPFALILVWAFNIEGTIDLLSAYIEGVVFDFPTLKVGPTWFIPTFYVPLLLVSHVLIFWFLLVSSSSSQTRDESVSELQ